MSFLKRDRVLSFIGGAAIAALGAVSIKTGCARKAAVKVMSCGMKAQDSVTRGFETLKEDAQDIYHESCEAAREKEGSDKAE